MERSEIESKIFSIIGDFLNRDDIRWDTPLLGKQGIMDSVTVVRFIRQMEKEFGIGFDDEDLDLDLLANVRTVTDLVMSYRGR